MGASNLNGKRNMKKKSPKSFKIHSLLVICMSISVIIFLLQLSLCIYYFVVLDRDATAITLTAAAMVLLICVILIFWFMYKPLRKLYFKLEKIRREMSGDSFWEWVDGADMVGQVLENIDVLFDRVRENADKAYRAELLSRQAEFSALQHQINPHFLYNTLDSIRGQALIADAMEIADMTEALSTFFRYNIEQKGDFVTLEDELNNVENYFLIQKFRFGNRFDYSLNIEDPYAMTYLMPKLTIQPVVENAILHGLEAKMGKGHIGIRVTRTAKRLILDISDDGVGMDKTILDSLRERIYCGYRQEQQKVAGGGTGIALCNVHQRIQLFFGENYGISVSSTPTVGTNVQIVIPLIQDMAGEMR